MYALFQNMGKETFSENLREKQEAPCGSFSALDIDVFCKNFDSLPEL